MSMMPETVAEQTFSAEEAAKQVERMAEAAAKRVRDTMLETMREIEQQLQLDALLEKLYQYPELIRHQQDAVSLAKQGVDAASSEVEFQTAVLQAQIAEERDGGKARFSNDTLRRAELAKRQATDPAYKAAAEALSRAEEAHRSAQFDLERLHNEFAAVRRALDVQSRRLAMMAWRFD